MADEVLTLRQWRSLKGLTQKELSERSGVTERTIAHYEKDTKRLRSAKYDTVVSLCKALDIKADNIFLGDTSENPKRKEA